LSLGGFNFFLKNTHPKKNLQKRLEFKEKLYELAQKRGYSVEKTTKLFIFVNELMKLTPELEYHYNHYVRTQEIKEKEMRVLSQSTLNLINDLARDAYGKSVEEYAKESEMYAKESEMYAKESEMQHAIIIRSIINLKDSMNLTAEQIASILELELAYVQNILAKVEE
jgi:hypothetical protein